MKPLTYGSLFSGTECMSAAAIGLPLVPKFFAEVEPYPCAILRSKFPNVPNLGDVTGIKYNPNTKEISNARTTVSLPDGLDILCGGSPCQDFSVAGKRAGADGDDLSDGGTTRSSLIFTYIRLLREIRPRYFIYENVPGMLTSNEGRDFAHFLVALGECGYEDVAWRVLDAQYVRVDGMERAVPQRRRRVWVVGRLGADYGGAAEILLEPHRDPGHLPPRRKTREEVAAGVGRWLELHGGMVGAAGRDLFGRVGGDGRGGVGAFNFELWANPPRNLIDALCARRAGDWMVADKPQGAKCVRNGSFGQFVPTDVSGTLECQHAGDVGNGTPCLVTDKPRAVACQHTQITMNCGEEFSPPIMARDYKDPAIVATAASFDPAEPGGLKTAVQDGSAVTPVNGNCPGHHNAIVQRVTNSNGGDVAPCLTSTDLVKQMTTEADKGVGYVIATFENHAQDSRVKDAANLAPTVGASNANSVGASGNNPLVVFAKVSHPRGKDGEGERWAQSNVAGTRNVFDGERAQEVVVEPRKSTCLTPGDPITKRVYTADGAAPTLQAIAEGSGISAQAFVLPQSADDLPRVIVRRLTPTECERLMGLPDNWTRVTFTPDQIADDALVEDFRRIHDAFAQMVAKPGTTPKPKTAKFVRDWLTRISDPATCPDAPRYKACGNGWAANCPRWILFNLLEFDHPHWQDEWFAPCVRAPQAVGAKHNNGPNARSMGEAEGVRPTLNTDCGVHESVAYGINAQASLMHPCTREVSQTLTVCHQGGG
jgi:site-specific DNA-cytosine methylase